MFTEMTEISEMAEGNVQNASKMINAYMMLIEEPLQRRQLSRDRRMTI
jgi:hypothetical protein